MPEQYRRDYEHEGRRGRGWSGSERDDGPRGDDRGRRPSDWRDERGGQYGRGEQMNRDGEDHGSQGRGITRESGWDRGGWGRDERDTRDWQQRVDESRQGYRSRDPMFDRGWQPEDESRSERQRAWRAGREWPHGGAPTWRHEEEGARWRSTEDRDWQGPSGGRRWGTGSAMPRDWRAESYGGSQAGQRRGESSGRWTTGGRGASEYGRGSQRAGLWNEEFGGETWQGRGHSQSAHEQGREGGQEPGGGRSWGGGSDSGRDIGGSRESVRPNYAGRGPKGYTRSDDRIREEISDRLMDDHDVDASEIEVEVKNGEVTLTGTVANRDQKRRAEELVERCHGVSDVTNNLRVNRQTAGEGARQGASQAGQTAQSNKPGGQSASQAGVGTQVDGGTSPTAGGSKPSRSTKTNS
jgi:hypothetical protein